MASIFRAMALFLVFLLNACSEQVQSNLSTQGEDIKYVFSNISAKDVREIVFLAVDDPWSDSSHLTSIAPAIKNRLDVDRFVNAMHSDFPAKSATEALAGIICYVVLTGYDGEVVQAAALLTADAVVSQTMIERSVPTKEFLFSETQSSKADLFPREAPNLGDEVLRYLKSHNSDAFKEYKFVWSHGERMGDDKAK